MLVQGRSEKQVEGKENDVGEGEEENLKKEELAVSIQHSRKTHK